MLDVREIRDCSSAGLGAVPNELISAKENLPIHTQFSVSLQSVAGSNVSDYWIRYLYFSLLALEYEAGGNKRERKTDPVLSELMDTQGKVLDSKILYHTF